MNHPVDWYDVDAFDIDSCSDEPRQGEVGIVAGEDSTLVTINPTVETRGGLAAGVPHTFLLMAGEMLQIQDGGKTGGTDDLSGSRIISDKPVGVFTGHVRTGIPTRKRTKNHLVEALPPLTRAGRIYLTMPLLGGGTIDKIRVMATEEKRTTVTITTPMIDSEDRTEEFVLETIGDFVDVDIDRPVRIVSDYSVQVGQYLSSDDRVSGGRDNGDPALVILEPATSYRSGATLMTHPIGQQTEYFGTIIVRTDDLPTLMINGYPWRRYSPLSRYEILANPEDSATATTMMSFQLPGAYGGNILEIDGPMTAYIAGASTFDAWVTVAGPPIPVVDIDAPRLTSRLNCPAQSARIDVTDSGDRNFGLDTALLLPGSSNVWLDIISGTEGSPEMEGMVTLLDFSRPGRAIIRSVDVAGNERVDTIDLPGPLPVSGFTPERVRDTGDVGAFSHVTTLLYHNDGELTDTLQRFRSTNGLATYKGQSLLLVEPGETVELTIESNLEEGSIRDTLIVQIGCEWALLPVDVVFRRPTASITDADFGTVEVGGVRCMIVTITNLTDRILTFTGAQIEGPFRFGPSVSLPFALGPGESREIEICFDPTDTGAVNGSVTLLGSGTSVATSLTGNGARTNSVGAGDRESLMAVTVDRATRTIRVRPSDDRDLRAVSLYGVTGELIRRVAVGPAGGSRVVIEIPEDLPTGLYYLVIDDLTGERGEMVRVVL